MSDPVWAYEPVPENAQMRCPDCGCDVPLRVDAPTNAHRLGDHVSTAVGPGRGHPCPGSAKLIAFLGARFAVTALFLDQAGRVLSVSRKNDPYDLGLPGGKADPGETPRDALFREIEEETGVVTVAADFVFLRDDYTAPGDPRPTIPAACFRVSCWIGDPRSIEAGVVRWVEPAAVVAAHCSFREYNTNLFTAVGLDFTSRS